MNVFFLIGNEIRSFCTHSHMPFARDSFFEFAFEHEIFHFLCMPTLPYHLNGIFSFSSSVILGKPQIYCFDNRLFAYKIRAMELRAMELRAMELPSMDLSILLMPVHGGIQKNIHGWHYL